MSSTSSFVTSAEAVLSVGELNRAVRGELEARFSLLWVAGEISSLTRAVSGHLYFTLKDAKAQVRCAIWRNKAQLLGFRPEHRKTPRKSGRFVSRFI